MVVVVVDVVVTAVGMSLDNEVDEDDNEAVAEAYLS